MENLLFSGKFLTISSPQLLPSMPQAYLSSALWIEFRERAKFYLGTWWWFWWLASAVFIFHFVDLVKRIYCILFKYFFADLMFMTIFLVNIVKEDHLHSKIYEIMPITPRLTKRAQRTRIFTKTRWKCLRLLDVYSYSRDPDCSMYYGNQNSRASIASRLCYIIHCDITIKFLVLQKLFLLTVFLTSYS